MAGLSIDRLLYATDKSKFDAILDWYETVFGATGQKINGGKEVWFDPEGGGPCDHIISPSITNMETWIPMVKVDSVQATVDKLPPGETPLVGPTQLNDDTWYVVFKDPAGARVGAVGAK